MIKLMTSFLFALLVVGSLLITWATACYHCKKLGYDDSDSFLFGFMCAFSVFVVEIFFAIIWAVFYFAI